MPRYFFNLVTPETSLVDEQGYELSDVTLAREAAASSAREIIQELGDDAVDLSAYAFNVTDDRGEQVMIFEFKTVLN